MTPADHAAAYREFYRLLYAGLLRDGHSPTEAPRLTETAVQEALAYGEHALVIGVWAMLGHPDRFEIEGQVVEIRPE